MEEVQEREYDYNNLLDYSLSIRRKIVASIEIRRKAHTDAYTWNSSV